MIQLKVWLLRAEEIKAQLIFSFKQFKFLTTLEIKLAEEGSWFFFCYLMSTFENKAFEVGRHSFFN